jgi:hypothetical protein
MEGTIPKIAFPVWRLGTRNEKTRNKSPEYSKIGVGTKNSVLFFSRFILIAYEHLVGTTVFLPRDSTT